MASRVEEFKHTVNEALNDQAKPWKALFDIAEEKTGVPRLYLFSGKCNNRMQQQRGAQLLCVQLIFASLKRRPRLGWNNTTIYRSMYNS